MAESKGEHAWYLSPEQERAMTEIARKLRREPTISEDRLWQAIRKRQLDGRKFRRQMPIGPFVVDFFCSLECLAVEVDGPIHESQRELDRQRQEMLEALGIRFVRVTADQVEEHLPDVLEAIRAAFLPEQPPEMRGGEQARRCRRFFSPFPPCGGRVGDGGMRSARPGSIRRVGKSEGDE